MILTQIEKHFLLTILQRLEIKAAQPDAPQVVALVHSIGEKLNLPQEEQAQPSA